MNYEYACGTISFTKKDNEIYYVIIESSEGYYGFPKGHVEKGETEEETALRETEEEVGLKVEIIPGFKKVVEHLIPAKANTMKQVTYFVAKYDNQEIKHQEEELIGANLMKFEDAINVFQFEEQKEILHEANEFIRKL